MSRIPALRPLPRALALTAGAIVLAATAGPALALAPAAVEIADDVAVVLEGADGPIGSGPLETAPRTWTAVSQRACEAPYDDGARAVVVQTTAAGESRVVLSGVDALEADGTARITVDGVLADVVDPGEAQLVVECVRVSRGIPEPAPAVIAQAMTITEDTWSIAGITVVPDPVDPADPADPVDPKDPKDPKDPAGPADPAEPADPADPAVPADPAHPADPAAPGQPAKPAQPAADAHAPGAAPQATGGVGALVRTGAEILGGILAAGALIAGGVVLVRRRGALTDQDR